MTQRPVLNWLVPVVLLLTVVAALAGLLWPGGSGPREFTSARGETVILSGEGLYQFDNVFTAEGFRGTDLVMLVVVVPFLAVTYWLYRRNSLRWALLLNGALAFALYYGLSLSLAASYNPMMLVYILLVAASLFAFVIALFTVDQERLADHFRPGLPNRALHLFLYISGAILFFVWMSDLLGSLIAGTDPLTLDHYTTVVTFLLDLGIIVPGILASAWLVQRRRPWGYLLGITLMVMCILIGIVVAGQTVYQVSAGIVLPPAQIAIFIGSFLAMAAVATFILVAFLRKVSEKPVKR